MMVESFQIKMDFGLNIFYFKVTMIIQTNMIYTQKIGLERKHKLNLVLLLIHIYELYYIMTVYHYYKDYLFYVDNTIYEQRLNQSGPSCSKRR